MLIQRHCYRTTNNLSALNAHAIFVPNLTFLCFLRLDGCGCDDEIVSFMIWAKLLCCDKANCLNFVHVFSLCSTQKLSLFCEPFIGFYVKFNFMK